MRTNIEVKFKWFIGVSVVLASIIGIYGQSITYYIVNSFFERNALLSCLTILTIISVLLFLIPALLIWLGIRKSKISKQVFDKYLMADVLVGIFISLWSILVLIAWWG